MLLNHNTPVESVVATLETQIPHLMERTAVVGLSIALIHDAQNDISHCR
jgi:hypothetical protein